MAMKFNIPKLNIKKLKPKDISIKKLKPKKKISKKRIVILSLVVIISSYFVISKVFMPKPSPSVRCTTLSKGSIVNNINVLGDVKSENSTNVYTTLSYPVKEIKVKVGDKVKAGDLLAILDSSSLEKDIEQSEATVAAAEANAKTELDSKKQAYDNAQYLYNNNLNAELTNANATVDSAKLNLDDKQKVYEYNKKLFQYGEISEQELKQKEMDFQNAKSDYDKAVVALENSKIKVKEELNAAKNSYEAAQTNYDNNSQKIALEKQKSDLEKCQIKAPADGTITAVNAVVGNPSTGILFTIEDLDQVIITASIKQVDIANVKVGQRVEVKTDAMGDETIDGEVVSVDPTAKKETMSTNGGNDQSAGGDLTFEAKIKINEVNDKIKVGMNARLNIILSEKSDIYTVQNESIVQDGDNTSLYVAEKNGDKYVIKQVPVTIGLESDFKSEVSGDGVSDGVLVVNDPSNFPVGSVVEISGGETIE